MADHKEDVYKRQDLTWFDEKMHKFSYILTSPWPSARQADV